MSANKRIVNELAQITADPVQDTTITLPSEQDIFKWEAKMTGPAESVYANGRFTLEISLPKEYPFKPPTISFKTKIYHPNVTNDAKGSMCLGILRSDSWKPPNRIREVLVLVRQILIQPQPDDAVESGIADQYKKDKEAFDKIAREWVGKYAST
ncbi:hypothetical protein AAFC00_001599 [Neodothiora populina]|uniref:UBC core domain-containing protein n=1 Tax=Neodothiora populina TaxID=2781224 RepID=A0ABR3PPP6_9PEZI